MPPAPHLPRVIAHRGAPRRAPENTLAAFRAAAAGGARWVEFDVALTADLRPVVFHDDTLERTTDGAGLLADTTFEQIKHLDAGSWFGPAFAGEMVPTLEEVLETLAELGLGFNMEIKPTPGREVETAHISLETARACWPGTAPVPLISSFSRNAVAVARDTVADWPRGLLFDRVNEDWAAVGRDLGVISFGANHLHLGPDTVAAMDQAHYLVTSYTVNDRARAETLFGWGVKAIFTDLAPELSGVFA